MEEPVRPLAPPVRRLSAARRPVPQAAFDLATRPGFDGLHDPDPGTWLIEPYHDPVGYPTIGYGHLLSREAGADLSRWPPITIAEAQSLLWADLARAARSVERLCPVPLSDPQFAALIDFTFNCGAGNLQASALRQVVIRGEHDEVPAQLQRWVYSRGRKWGGLVRRRRAEAELYLAGVIWMRRAA